MVATLACALLIVDLFIEDEEKHVTYWLTIVTLAGTAVLTAVTLGQPTIVTFQGMFVADPLSQMLKVATLLTVVATLVLYPLTAIVRGQNDTTGVGLIEVYDLP